MSYGVGLRNGVAFALGTIPSLTSGGGLRPSLLLNFLSGTLDSRITFSRGTQATQYTSNGTLQYAPNNLLTYSNQADNAAWTKSNSFVQTNLITQSNAFTTAPWNVRGTATATANSTTSPDGTQNGWLIAGIGVLLNDVFQQITVASGVSYTPSFWIKRVSTTGTLQIANPAGSNGAMNLNMALLSNDWERITPSHPAVTVATAFSGSPTNTGGIHLLNSSGGLLSFYLYGAQVVLGSVPGDYVATTSAALPVLYADYQGKLRARKIAETATTAFHYITNATLSLTAGQTISIYAKAGERTLIGIYRTANSSGACFNLSTGTLFNVGGTATTATTFTQGEWTGSISSAGNGWYRCILTLAASATVNTGAYYIAIDTAYQSNYTGDGSSGIYIADAQLEAGSTVQAYNDTTSAAYYGPRFDYDPTNYVRQNLLTYSQDFTNAVWGKSNCTVTGGAVVAPDGTLTGTLVSVPATAFAYVNFTSGVAAATATNNTFVISVLAGAVNSVELGLYDGTGWGTGTATIISGPGSLTNTTGSRYLVSGLSTSQWTRVAITRTSASATGLTPYIYPRAQGTSQAGDTLYIWGAQLNTGSTALTYTATTTAPYTLVAARGLLIEEQRTNLLTYSNDYTNVIWSNTNITVTSANTTGPDGTLSGSKLAATASAATVFYQTAAVAATSATGSVFAKQGTSAIIANTFILRNVTTATDLVGGTLNYSTGVFTYSVGSTGVVVTNVGNGWWRVALSATAGITSSDSIRLYVGYGGVAATAGDFLYAYGAQLEAGAFATSYIPTVGSSVTRNADSASITTLTPWFNAAAGTMVASFDVVAAATGGGMAIASLDNNTVNGYLLYKGVSTASMSAYAGANNSAIGSITANTVAKAAVTYDGTNNAGVLNGAAPVAITAAAVTTPTQLEIGRTFAGNQLSGHIQAINYYPTRLPNATLQGLTV